MPVLSQSFLIFFKQNLILFFTIDCSILPTFRQQSFTELTHMQTELSLSQKERYIRYILLIFSEYQQSQSFMVSQNYSIEFMLYLSQAKR